MALLNYFSSQNLLVRTERLDLTPRRRISASRSFIITSASFSGGSVTTFTRLDLPLTDVLTENDGLIFDHIAGSIAPAPVINQTPPINAITDMALALTSPFGTSGAALPTPLILLQAPLDLAFVSIRNVVTFTAKCPFVSGDDLNGFFPPPGLFQSGRQPLQLSLSTTFLNPEAVNRPVIISLQALYRVVHGVDDG